LRVSSSGPGRPRTRPDALLADKAYSSRAIRARLRGRRVEAVIPEPADQRGHRLRRGSRGGRPPRLDQLKYRQRNNVERSFNQIKDWKGLATRYDQLAIVYRAGAVLAAVLTWTKDLTQTLRDAP
jgi:putative transposase